jgi:hypothetical protein
MKCSEKEVEFKMIYVNFQWCLAMRRLMIYVWIYFSLGLFRTESLRVEPLKRWVSPGTKQKHYFTASRVCHVLLTNEENNLNPQLHFVDPVYLEDDVDPQIPVSVQEAKQAKPETILILKPLLMVTIAVSKKCCNSTLVRKSSYIALFVLAYRCVMEFFPICHPYTSLLRCFYRIGNGDKYKRRFHSVRMWWWGRIENY